MHQAQPVIRFWSAYRCSGFWSQTFHTLFCCFGGGFVWLSSFVFLPDLQVLFHALIKMKFLQLQMPGHLEAPFSYHFAKPYCLKYKMTFLNDVQ